MLNHNKYDIIIVGGGMVGMTIALGLAQQTELSIAIVEANPNAPTFNSSQYYPRVSAIALASVNIFKSLNIWQHIKSKRVSPFTHMQVWDALGSGQVDFDCRDVAKPELGYIIENAVLQTTMHEQVVQHDQIDFIAPVKLASLSPQADRVDLQADDGATYAAKLVIAADGGRSWVRDQVGINIKAMPYDQKGLVTAVTTALPHQRNARQVFLATGPLAFLPLADPHQSSIVWTLPTTVADEKLALDDNEFKRQLAAAFSHRLGDITHIEKRFAFPLQKQQASTYIANRVALAGDAAHTIHPLAGQGVNMGLLDATSLVDVISTAHQKNQNYAGKHVLRRYERWRRTDNAGLMSGMDVIKNLFASDKHAIQVLRSTGLSMTNQINWLRQYFIRHAIGDRADMPTLATSN